MCVCAKVCTWCAHTNGHLMSSCIVSYIISKNTDSHQTHSSLFPLNWLMVEPLGSFCPALLVLRLHMYTPTPGFHMGYQTLNSGCHTHATSSFPVTIVV